MMARTITDLVRREVPLLRLDTPIGAAIEQVVDADVPALPVIDASERYAGIFGERELITALFPGYVGTLGRLAFVPKSIEAAIDKRQSCKLEPVENHMNREHIDVGTDFSDVGLAEIFIHHRVLIVPITDGGRVHGLVTRRDFFLALVERLR
jgi:CBS domain-containing protein